MTEKEYKYLTDVLLSIELIEKFTSEIKSFRDYVNDLKTQSAVERQLGIIGEAVNKFDSIDPENSLENARFIIAFRNRLIHAYDSIDNSIVWAIIKNHLETLKVEILKKIE